MFFKDILKTDLLSAIKTKLIKQSKNTLRAFIDSLPKQEQDLFLEYKVEELFDLSVLQKETKAEEKKSTPSVAVNKDEYVEKVTQFLKEGGVGESGRGYKTSEISEACGGDDDTTRKTLSTLAEEKKVFSTGKTRKMRWVHWDNKKAAEVAFAKQEQNS